MVYMIGIKKLELLRRYLLTKYYIVSEEELETLIIATADFIRASYGENYQRLEECEELADTAEEACRARPLRKEFMSEDLYRALLSIKGYSLRGWVKAPDWATHYVKLNELNNIEQMEEVTR